MTDVTVIGPIPEESENLRLHVDLCAQRYNQLIHKFDEVDQRLDSLTQLCAEIKTNLVAINTSTQATYLKWAGFVIVVLTGVIGGLIGKLV